MGYLRGVLLARLDSETPPVRPGALVRHRDPEEFSRFLREDASRELIVEDVRYMGSDLFRGPRGEKWDIKLKDIGDGTTWFPLNKFQIVASDPTITTHQPA